MSSGLPGSGVLLVDKSAGWTSFDVVAALRPILGTRRVGHGGTLDPFATGLLPILYGQATRLADHLHRAPKAYLGEMVLGAETDTDDATGAVTETAAVPHLDEAAIEAAFAGFRGTISQRPPAYAAVRVGGEHAYARARRGEDVRLAERVVEIHDLRLVERGERCLHFLVVCSAGTYVRALARDLGRALGTRAHLGALRRIAAGGFSVDEAVPIDEVRELAAAGALASLVFAADAAALELPGTVVAAETARRLLAGQRVPMSGSGAHRAYSGAGAFLGIVETGDDTARPRTMFGREAAGDAPRAAGDRT